MYRVFTADDNQLSRQSLLLSVDWKEKDCEVVAEASSGTEALEKIQLFQPDIAFLDIKMPGMSGLEVAAQIKNLGIECVCVMVTAYDDFEFIQRGLKLGVFDYILKPVNDIELNAVLDRAIAEVTKRRRQESEMEGLKHSVAVYHSEMQESSSEIKRKLLNDGINGYAESAHRLQRQLREEYNFHDCELMLLVPEGLDKQDKDKLMADDFILQIRELLEDCSKRFRVRLLDGWRKEGMVVLIVYQDVLLTNEYHLTSLKIANWILEKKTDRQISISISGLSKKLTELPELFRQAVFCHNSRFFIENHESIHYESLRSRSVTGAYEKSVQLEDFYRSCRENPENLEEALQNFLHNLAQDSRYDIDFLKSILVQSAIMMTCLVREENGINQGMRDVNEITEEIQKTQSIQEAFGWMLDYARILQNRCMEQNQNSHQTRKIMNYLNEHYAEHIALSDVADYMGLSTAHICRVLKNDTGETFVTLLNKIRIMEAIRLLKKEKMKVYEVAEAVGFSNYAYFYQLFRKETGASPKDYQ